MSARFTSMIAAIAVFAFALDLGLSMHHLNVAHAAISRVVTIHPQKMCPASATSWCRATGGLAE
jgi:hypothetical protein